MYRVWMIMCLLAVLVGCGIEDQSMMPIDSAQVDATPTKTIKQPRGGQQTTPARPTPSKTVPATPKIGDKVMMNPLWDPEKPQALPEPIVFPYADMDIVQDVSADPTFRDTKQLSIIGAFKIDAWLPASSRYQAIFVSELLRNDGSITFAALAEDNAKTIISINSMSYQFPGLKAQTLIAEIDGSLFIVGRVDDALKGQVEVVAVDRFVDATYPSEVQVKAGAVKDGFFVIPIEGDERDAWQYLTHIRLLVGATPDAPLQDLNFHGPFAYDQGITTIH